MNEHKHHDMNSRIIAEKIFLAGVAGVLPDRLVSESVSLKGEILKTGEITFEVNMLNNIYVTGAGKASAAMAHHVEAILGKRITGGHVVTRYGNSCTLKKIKVTEAGHPFPDVNSFKAAGEIMALADKAGENDLVICLISGGGSALMTDLPEGLFPEEIHIVNNLLVKCGATIHEINTVRKHLSEVKGGQLATRMFPATLVNLILSDVVGNQIDVIASGPTVPDMTTYRDAYKVLEDHNLLNDVTEGIKKYLREGIEGLRPDTPKPGDQAFTRTYNILIGTNATALEASRKYAAGSGYNPYIITDSLSGDVEDVVQKVIDTAISYRNNPEVRKPLCLLFGGETTVKVTGTGLGGRNQHLALTATVRLKDLPGITILSAGTDGNDGPTDAAGAVVDSSTFHYGLSVGKEPEKYLGDFDSYGFFKSAGGHIFTGPTFTNVMDMVVVLVE